MQLVFGVGGIGMRVWNSTELALSEDPSNSTLAQGVRVTFGSGDLIELVESDFRDLARNVETSYTLNQFGSFSLAAVGEIEASILILTWGSDKVTVTQEKQPISVLTLVAIITGACAVAIDLIFKNFVILFYALFIYQHTDEWPR